MRRLALLAVPAVVAAVLAAPLAADAPFPAQIDLPNGWQPEGIAVSHGGTFYAGSIPTGAVFSGDLRTGKGSVLVPGGPGRAATGLKVDHGRLFVAGASTGKAFVYDARTGADVATYQLTTLPTFINDVVVTRSGAYFTDSVNQVLYRVPIGHDGTLGAAAETIPLTGDIAYTTGFNANGIDATPDGGTLVVVQTNVGKVFTVDPDTGVTKEIALDEAMTAGDGILLDGRTLYVVRNVQNRVAVIRLSHDLSSGTVTGYLTDPGLDVPTTIAAFGHFLYAVNARFSTPPGPDVPYWVTRLERS